MKQIVVALILVLLSPACTHVDAIKIDITSQPDIDPKKSAYVEKKLGENAYYFLLLNYKVVDDPSIYNRLRKLGTRITYYAERPELEYKYLVIDSKYNRAFSMPDGYIVFSTAMIDSLKTDENIQAVIAHEVAHLTHRHSVYFLKSKYGEANVQNITGEKIISLPAQLGYKRAFELQADLMGMRYLIRSGLNPENLINVLQKLDELQKHDQEELKSDVDAGVEDKRALKKDPIAELEYPDLSNRIIHCRQKLDEIKQTEKVKYQAKDFQE